MGHNVFLTGAAGSGKTHTLRAYIKYLRENNIGVAITASTGIAATHLGGMTIHSWSGLGIRDKLTSYDLEIMEEKKNLWKRYQETKVLIIDEISMLHHFRFDLLNLLAQTFKRSPKPFGGMQIILCGDFFQLPPVTRPGEPPAYFAYKSDIWHNMNLKICYLSEQHRQNDDRYLNLLNDIRSNEVSEETLECLRERYRKNIELDIEPTRLSTHNEDVDKINNTELDKIPGEERTFLMDTKGKSTLVETLKKSCLAPEELRLKIGTRVMFVKNNNDKGYVNGTLGIVDSFSPESDPVIRVANGRKITAVRESWMVEEDGKVKAELKQYPLRLAWAITIHKSQGMSLDAAEIDLSRAFVAGMGYVALSRVKSLAGLKLMGFSHQALQIHPEVLEIDRELKERSNDAVDELIEVETGLGSDSLADLQAHFVKANASSTPIRDPYNGAYGKVDEFGNIDMTEIDIDEVAQSMRKKMKNSSQMETKELLIDGKSIDEIAVERGLKPETILEHIEFLIDEKIIDDEHIDLSYLKARSFKGPKGNAQFSKIKQAFLAELEKQDTATISHLSELRLAPVKNKLGNSYSYADIRLVRLLIRDELVGEGESKE